MISTIQDNITFKNLAAINDTIASLNPSKIAVLVDSNTENFCLPILMEKCEQELEIIKIKSGESHKTLDTCSYIWQQMLSKGMDRESLMINLGGGVIGDIGGYCAATYMRGISFIQIPTTLLSQVDASIGGKLGFDFQGFKNIIGLFQTPIQTFISPIFLKTLPYRQLLSGFAEVIKHALIKDKAMFNSFLETNAITELDFDEIIPHSIQLKREIVNLDPKEKGYRKILNFGHTIGHAIESFLLPSEVALYHGEAIAIGMVAESYVSYQKNLLSKEDYLTIKKYIKTVFGDKSKSLTNLAEITNFTLKDKKNSRGKIMMSIISDIGQCEINQEVTLDLIIESLEDYKR